MRIHGRAAEGESVKRGCDSDGATDRIATNRTHCMPGTDSSGGVERQQWVFFENNGCAGRLSEAHTLTERGKLAECPNAEWGEWAVYATASAPCGKDRAHTTSHIVSHGTGLSDGAPTSIPSLAGRTLWRRYWYRYWAAASRRTLSPGRTGRGGQESTQRSTQAHGEVLSRSVTVKKRGKNILELDEHRSHTMYHRLACLHVSGHPPTPIHGTERVGSALSRILPATCAAGPWRRSLGAPRARWFGSNAPFDRCAGAHLLRDVLPTQWGAHREETHRWGAPAPEDGG